MSNPRDEIDAVRARLADQLVDWNFVCSYMHYSGKNCSTLSAEQKWDVYCLGDGFGRMSSAELKEINDGWDWSHIRDSSNAAICEMADKIRRFLMIKGMREE